jgi:RNA polymerase sigma-70 factor, ECF subfamily
MLDDRAEHHSLREAAGLDPERLPELIDRLYRAAWAISGSPHDAEDLVQETFARALARPRALRNADPAPYLMQTLRNTYLTGLRTAGRRPRTSELPAEESSRMESTLARPEVALEHGQTLAAISALSQDFREALVAVDIVGLTYREAADAAGTQEATIATRLFRARRAVVRALSEENDALVGKKSP